MSGGAKSAATHTQAMNRSAHIVCLTGFMGAGKSSVGRALAQRRQQRFFDLDERIEARTRRTVAEIFQNSGEAAFRQIEAEELRNALTEAGAGAVIALGGGAFVQADNVRALRAARATVVFLDAPAEALYRRCQGGPGRPLAGDEANFRRLHAARRPAYLKADVTVDAGDESPEQVAARVEAALRRFTGDQEAT